MDITVLIVIGAILALVLLTALILLFRYKKCPPDQLLIKSGAGKTISMNTASVVDEIDEDGNRITKILPVPIDTSIKIYQGKGALILPLVQTFHRMSLKPYTITSQVMGPDNGFIDTYVDTALNTAISGKPDLRLNAVSRFLTTERTEVAAQIKLILDGAIRHVIATMSIEELNNNRDKFLEQIKETLAPKLALLGFDILDINIQRIYDQVDFLNNLGKKKETEARANALADIAEKEKDGEIRKAQIARDQATQIATAKKEQETKVKETEKDQAVRIAQIEKDREIETATALNLKEVGKAAQLAEQQKNVANHQAEGRIGAAQAKAQADAEVAKATSNAIAAENEALANQEIRIAQAEQKQEAETAKATQNAEAQKAEYKSDKEQRQAEAEKKAGVARENAKVAVADAAAKAGAAEAARDKTIKSAQVDATMTVAKLQQERDFEVNEAKAKAEKAKLTAEKIVPAEMEKQTVLINADASKQQTIIEAEAQAEAIRKKAEAEAAAIKLKKEAEAAGVEAMGKAEGAREEAIAVGRARGVQQEALAEAMAIERMIQAAGGDVNALTQLRLTEHVEAGYNAISKQFEGLRDANITVYGNPSAAGDLIGNLVTKGAPALQFIQDGLKKQVLDTFGLGKKTEIPEKTVEASKEPEK
jgi:flotillin